MTADAITQEAINPIKEYCTNRQFKCKGCRYSIKFIIPEYDGHACCVFGNCPCDWDEYTEPTIEELNVVQYIRMEHVISV